MAKTLVFSTPPLSLSLSIYLSLALSLSRYLSLSPTRSLSFYVNWFGFQPKIKRSFFIKKKIKWLKCFYSLNSKTVKIIAIAIEFTLPINPQNKIKDTEYFSTFQCFFSLPLSSTFPIIMFKSQIITYHSYLKGNLQCI